MSLEQESHPKNVLIQNKLVPKGILFLLHLLEFLTLNHFQKETIKYYYSNIEYMNLLTVFLYPKRAHYH